MILLIRKQAIEHRWNPGMNSTTRKIPQLNHYLGGEPSGQLSLWEYLITFIIYLLLKFLHIHFGAATIICQFKNLNKWRVLQSLLQHRNTVFFSFCLSLCHIFLSAIFFLLCLSRIKFSLFLSMFFSFSINTTLNEKMACIIVLYIYTVYMGHSQELRTCILFQKLFKLQKLVFLELYMAGGRMDYYYLIYLHM